MFTKAWVGWGLTIAGVLSAAPLVLGRGNPSVSPARETITQMSEVERAGLKRKYEQYRSLTEQQRADLRKLHQQLEEDRSKGPRYIDAMRVYCDWLKTIDAWQQDELAHIEQPQEKANRVASLVKERAAEADSTEGEDGPGVGPLQRGRLNESQLTRVFDLLTRRVKLTEEEQKQVDGKHGLRRFGTQIRFLREKSGQNFEKVLRSLSDAEVAELVEETGNAELKSLTSSVGDVSLRRRALNRVIFKSCVLLSQDEASALTEDQLRAHLATLPPERQDQLLQLRGDQFKAELQRSLMMSDPDIGELRNPIEREGNLARRRLQGGAAGNGQKGEGKGPRRDGDAGKFPRPFFGGPPGRGPGDREPPDEPPPPRP